VLVELASLGCTKGAAFSAAYNFLSGEVFGQFNTDSM
jgi:hypothetical protein